VTFTAGPARILWAALVALLAGSAVNLTAGLRRPLRERAMLRANEYAAAQQACAALQRTVPPGEPVALVVPDHETAEWLREYMQWLAYPRTFSANVVERGAALRARDTGTTYLLLFSRSGPPPHADGRLTEVAAGPTWRLARQDPL
jgi:hypothetical protein